MGLGREFQREEAVRGKCSVGPDWVFSPKCWRERRLAWRMQEGEEGCSRSLRKEEEPCYERELCRWREELCVGFVMD